VGILLTSCSLETGWRKMKGENDGWREWCEGKRIENSDDYVGEGSEE